VNELSKKQCRWDHAEGGERMTRVQIVNKDHPHFEEYGRFTGKIITMRFGLKKQMAEVALESCRHGVDACFVSKGDVKQVAER
jgi:regulator of RNase E activity RraA